ncbi:FG-GAP-like repeat-containing protein [Flavobacterium piscis]|nr:FG-GAP-like repeat-containing protein [Flavobacterium piscis]
MKKLYFTFMLLYFSFLLTAQTEKGKIVTGTTIIKRIESATENKTSLSNIIKNAPASVTILASPTGNSSETGTTQGELSVSGNGGANYKIPIATPPGINGVIPNIYLSYSSQGGNGNAGFGWNISGISSISRIAASKFHDGTIDPVDFNTLDRFAFDGQRLIIKTGTSGAYGANTTVYETENFSNVKITSRGIHPNGSNYGPEYFIVEYPDGSKAYYGNSADSRSITDWSITYWENPQGIRISYSYEQTNNITNVSSIKYGAVATNSPINEIQFTYKIRQRPEQMYVGGQNLLQNKILSQVTSWGNSVPFRNYLLQHETTTLDYQRLISITERSGDGTKSYNPTVFSYDTTAQTIVGSPITSSLSVGSITSANSNTVSGDFNGDGSMDFILYPTVGSDSKAKYWLFSGLQSGNSMDIGWQHPVGKFEEIFPATWLNSDNKLMPLQAWVVAKSDSFTTYAKAGSGITQQDQKLYTFPKFTLTYFYPCDLDEPVDRIANPNLNAKAATTTKEGYIEKDVPKTYISGDFNGDGLTDAVVIEKSITYTMFLDCTRTITQTLTGGRSYFVNLDRRVTTDFVNQAGILSTTNSSKFLVADFNGDGKSDIYVFDTGGVKIYSLNDSKQFVLLFKTPTNDPNITIDKILMGDYNGDGKTDFIIPKGPGYSEWYKYSSTGINLIKETQTYFTFPTNSSNITYSVIPSDYNNDGKTDLLVANSSRASSTGSLGISCYINKNGGFSSVVGNSYSGGILNQPDIYSDALPIFLSANQFNKKLELSFINNNKIYIFNSTKDSGKEQLLKGIVTGNGITESISYMSLDSNSYQDNRPIYYSSPYTENYPYTDIIVAPTFQVVTKLERTSSTTYKKQLFTYYGAVSNIEGLGFLGFRSTLKTNWFDDSKPIISDVTRNNINLRGASVENYTVLGYASLTNQTPSDYISRTTLTYESQLLPNKVYKLSNTITQKYNGLDNTNSETTNVFDIYNNPTQTIAKVKEGSAILQTTTGIFTYENQTTGSPYIIGRLTSKTQSTIVSGDTSTSEELYAYTNNLLTQVKKKGTDTEYLIEDNIFDTYGNVIQKSISTSGLAPRITKYEYDSSGRFLTKSTDIEGLSTIYDYNSSNGSLNFQINPSGLKTSYLYDSWLKKIKTTDYLGKTNNYTYSNSSGKTIITTTGDDGSASEETFDDLGRKIKTGVKNINDVFSYVSYNYDFDNRNNQISEPYFGSAPTQWNTTYYDTYGRPYSNISYTGTSSNITYSGLTTSVSENGKTKTIIKNALGNVISLTESPGGNITYTYFADGNLKSSNFDGVITLIEQDGWGRKTKLTDPSAGIYTYEYNTFGEITKETTPNGTTTFTLDNVGKISQKTINGTNTNSKTTYTYDSTSKLLSDTKFENLNESGSIITNLYTYDASKRVSQTIEITPYASFTKKFEYDFFGRVNKETSTASISGKSSSKAVKYSYKNGFIWQILDDSDGTVLSQTNTVNAKGKLTSGQNGPTTITNNFDSYGFPSQVKYDKTAAPVANILTLNTVFNPLKGNLTSRSNNLFGWDENFKYDILDRLTEYTNINGVQETQLYDDKGRITQNNVGTYNYSNTNKPYQNTSITVTSNALSYYTARPTLHVTYNTFKKPVQIEETGVDKLAFTYNDGNERSTIFYGGLEDDKLLRPFRKHYSADGTMEIKENRTTGDFEFVTYIGGDGYTASVVLKSDGTTQNFLYLQRDYQNSIIAITDQAGSIVEKRLFDAWGNIIKVQDGAGNTLQGLIILDRGYTGHEHLQSIGIINMNGRIYDPKLHRFLQPDNFIQDLSNTQNYNRYSYVLNNPLKYTDFTGESWFSDNWKQLVVMVVVVVVAVVVTYATAGMGSSLAASMIVGAASGFAGGAVGSALNGNNFGQVMLDGAFGGVKGAVFGAAGGYAASFAPPGILNGAAYAISTNVALNGVANIVDGQDPFANVGFTIAISAVTGGYQGLKAAQAKGLNTLTGNPKPTVLVDKVDISREQALVDYQKTSNTQQEPVNMSSTATADNSGYVDLSKNPEFAKIENLQEVVVHGNSLKSLRPTWGYKLYTNEGVFLKNGITSKLIPESRYSKSFMQSHYMETAPIFSNRLEAYQWEYQQNIIQRGPLNLNMH